MDAPEPPSPAASADWPAIAAALAPAMAQAAGPSAHPVSLAFDLAAPAHGPLACRAWVERATRTLVFLGAEARTGEGALAASVAAVFRRG